MALIKEIEIALPFVAELPETWQHDIAEFISRMVTNHDNVLTMTAEERARLTKLDLEAFERRWRNDD